MTRPYHYQQCGLDNVYLRNGFEIEATKYGETIRIHDIDGLHRAIGLCLIEERKVLAGTEIRFLRHEMDLSQKTLGELLEKSDQTVARWEKGESKADGPADRLIRLLYESYATYNQRHSARELLERLARLDADLGNLQFEDTGRGWSRAAA